MKVDQKTIDWTFKLLNQRGVDVEKLVGRPKGLLDGKEIDDIEAALSARPGGLDEDAGKALATLRALEGQDDVTAPVAANGLKWNIRVRGGIGEADVATLRTALGVAAPAPLHIGPDEFFRLSTLPNVPPALLRRIGQSEGCKGWLGIDVSIIRPSTAPIGEGDLRLLDLAFGIKPKNGRFDAECLAATQRALTANGPPSAAALNLVDRLRFASLDQVHVKTQSGDVVIDTDTPALRNTRGLLATYLNETKPEQQSFPMPEIFSTLAQAMAKQNASDADFDTLRALIDAHGKDADLPGPGGVAVRTKVNAAPSADDIKWFADNFGSNKLKQYGINLDDGVFGADDVAAFDRAVRSGAVRLSGLERDVWVERLFACNGTDMTLPSGKHVKIAPKDLTPKDIDLLHTGMSLDISKGVVHFVDWQHTLGVISPQAAKATVDTLTDGLVPDAQALGWLRARVDQRIAAVSSFIGVQPKPDASDSEGQKTRAGAQAELDRLQSLKSRLAIVEKSPFNTAVDRDLEPLKTLTADFVRLSPAEMSFAMRVRSAGSQSVDLGGGKKVAFDLTPPPLEIRVVPDGEKGAPSAEEIKNQRLGVLDADGRINRDGSMVLTLHGEDKSRYVLNRLDVEIGMQPKDGVYSVRTTLGMYNWKVLPNIWASLYGGGGVRWGDGTTTWEASGSAKLRWRPNERTELSAGVNMAVAVQTGAYDWTSFNQAFNARTDQLKADVTTAAQKDFGPAGDAISSAVDSEFQSFSQDLGPLLTQLGKSLIPGGGNTQAAQQAISNRFNQVISNIETKAGPIGSAAATQFGTDCSNLAAPYLSDVLTLGLKQLQTMLSETYTGVLGSANVTLRTSIPISQVLQVPLMVSAYGKAPLGGSGAHTVNFAFPGDIVDTRYGTVGMRLETGLSINFSSSSVALTGGVDLRHRFDSGSAGLLEVPNFYGRVAYLSTFDLYDLLYGHH